MHRFSTNLSIYLANYYFGQVPKELNSLPILSKDMLSIITIIVIAIFSADSNILNSN